MINILTWIAIGTALFIIYTIIHKSMDWAIPFVKNSNTYEIVDEAWMWATLVASYALFFCIGGIVVYNNYGF